MVTERLAGIVAASGLSDRALSVLAGLSPTHVTRILAGQRPNVSLATVAAIAKVTGVSLDYLAFGGRRPKGPTIKAAVARAKARARRAQTGANGTV